MPPSLPRSQVRINSLLMMRERLGDLKREMAPAQSPALKSPKGAPKEESPKMKAARQAAILAAMTDSYSREHASSLARLTEMRNKGGLPKAANAEVKLLKHMERVVLMTPSPDRSKPGSWRVMDANGRWWQKTGGQDWSAGESAEWQGWRKPLKKQIGRAEKRLDEVLAAEGHPVR